MQDNFEVVLWKFEKVCEVQRQWRCEFVKEPPTRVTIASIRDKFEVDGTVRDVHKQRYGRPCTATSPAFSAWRWNGLHDHHKSSQNNTLYGNEHFTSNKIAHHHTTTKTSEATMVKTYQVDG
jgi:hypothetical protein